MSEHEFSIGDMAWSTRCNVMVQVAGPLERWDKHYDGDRLVTEPTYAHRVVTLQRHHVNRSLIAKPCDLRHLEQQWIGNWNSLAEKLGGWKPEGLRA